MKKLTFLVLILFVLNSFGQDKQTSKTNSKIEAFQNDIEILRNQNKELQNEIFELNQIKNSNDKYKKNLENIQSYVEKAEKRESLFLTILMIIGSFITVGIGILSFTGFRSLKEENKNALNTLKQKHQKEFEETNKLHIENLAKVKNELQETFLKEISDLVKAKFEHINNIINSEVWLSDLRKIANILVVHKQGTVLDKGVKEILNLTGLAYKAEEIKELTFDNIKNLLRNKTAVFIDNANSGTENTWEKEDIEPRLIPFGDELLKRDIPLFYFNTAKESEDSVRFPTLKEKNYLTSFANTESNIYPNLKNLFIVQKLLEEKKHKGNAK